MQSAKAGSGRYKGYAVVRDQYGRIKVDNWDNLDPPFRNYLFQLWAQGGVFVLDPPRSLIEEQSNGSDPLYHRS